MTQKALNKLLMHETQMNLLLLVLFKEMDLFHHTNRGLYAPIGIVAKLKGPYRRPICLKPSQ